MAFIEFAFHCLYFICCSIGAFLFFLTIQGRFVCNLHDSVFKATAEILLYLSALLSPVVLAGFFFLRRGYTLFTNSSGNGYSMLASAFVWGSFVAFCAFTVSAIKERRKTQIQDPAWVRIRTFPRFYQTRDNSLPPLPSINRIYDLNLLEITLRIPCLDPCWKGLRIGHLTDFHVAGVCHADYVRHAVELVVEKRPDLIAITGDFVDFPRYIDECLGLLEGLTAPLGVFVVRGNHDYWTDPETIRERILEFGYTLLDHRTVEVHRNGSTMIVSGVESPWNRSRDSLHFIPEETDRLKIVLSHSPDEFPRLLKRSPHLVLSGHTHGGQICFPFYGPVLVPSKYGRKFAAGVIKEGKSILFVNRGIGCYPPVRTLCNPEVAVLELT